MGPYILELFGNLLVLTRFWSSPEWYESHCRLIQMPSLWPPSWADSVRVKRVCEQLFKWFNGKPPVLGIKNFECPEHYQKAKDSAHLEDLILPILVKWDLLALSLSGWPIDWSKKINESTHIFGQWTDGVDRNWCTPSQALLFFFLVNFHNPLAGLSRSLKLVNQIFRCIQIFSHPKNSMGPPLKIQLGLD